MKSNRLVTLSFAALLLVGCASGNSKPAAPESSRAEQYRQKGSEDAEEGSRPPRIGMSKSQVINAYGEPTNVSSSGSGGETWSYVFNNFDGRDFIPFYGDIHAAFKTRRSGVIFFNTSGRVKDFTWNGINPKGASIWR